MYNPRQPFDLRELPPPIKLETHPNLNKFFHLTMGAQKAISELNGLLSRLDNPDLLLSSLYLQESVSSNAVENIHTTIASALEDETKPERERSSANKEVLNYRDALLAGHKSLEKYGLSSRTIKAIHKKLKVTRGVPGEYREQQNNLTNELPDGTRQVIYTPPVHTNIPRLLGNWENFVDKNDQFTSLVKTAICHYQFEAVHPFEDGNGRTGRILMILQLVQDDQLDYPALFISSYLSKHEERYKKLLLEVTSRRKWWEFIEFVILGFAVQATETLIALNYLELGRLELIAKLRVDDDNVVKSSSIETVINHLFTNPTTHAKFMESETGIHWQTCTKYLNYLSKLKILSQEKRGRYRLYSNNLAIKALSRSQK